MPLRRSLPTAAEALAILGQKRSRPQRRPPPVAGKSLAKLVKSLDERFGQGASGLQARWKEIVGETLARRTEPVKLVKQRAGGGVLEIRVDGPAAALVQHQVPEILARVELYLGAGSVSRLRIVQGPVKKPAAQTAALRLGSARRRPPLDAAREAELAQSLAAAPETPLKAALLKLGREVLRNE